MTVFILAGPFSLHLSIALNNCSVALNRPKPAAEAIKKPGSTGLESENPFWLHLRALSGSEPLLSRIPLW